MNKQKEVWVIQPNIKDIALIGDKKTCALIDKNGTIVWYCLWRFDQPSLFSLLIDKMGGFWSVEADGIALKKRYYKNNSAILVTEFTTSNGSFSITDCMPMDSKIIGISRLFSPAPVTVTTTIFPKPDYSRSSASINIGQDDFTIICSKFEFYIKASLPLKIEDDKVVMTIPAGEEGWAVMADDKRTLPYVSYEFILKAITQTENKWKSIMSNISYSGAYKSSFDNSYRAIQLVTHEKSGGILAAATTSLPEVIGGSRNYDYRYVWLRDTGMVVSALAKAETKGEEPERFLDFLCAARNTNKKNLFIPFYDLDNKTAPYVSLVPGSGYKNSKPLRIGNGALDQLQLDAQGNVLLAAKHIYDRKNHKPHWETIVHTADFLVENWHKKDHGIWEEGLMEHFTSSKVLVASSLEYIAAYTDNESQKLKWIQTAMDIRIFVLTHCMTSEGAYAVFAGSEDVDITAALYPYWQYDAADSLAMIKTIHKIEIDYKDGELYHRRLEEFPSRKEGVFLAASLWMAQYYLCLNDLEKAKTIVDAVLEFSTDLGFLPEEGDVKTGELLGNIPQTFVHSSLISVLLEFDKLQQKKEN